MKMKIQKIKLFLMTDTNGLNGPNWVSFSKDRPWNVYQVTMNLGEISVMVHKIIEENKRCLLTPAGKTLLFFYFLKTQKNIFSS